MKKTSKIISKIKFALYFLSIAFSISTFAAKYSFVLQSSDHVGEKNYELEVQWLRELEEKSDGRLEFELLPNGNTVDYVETLDAIRLGVLDGHLTSVAYFSDKDPAIEFISTTVGAWSETEQLMDYMYNGGGSEIMQKLYDPHGVKFVGAFTTGGEALVSKVPLDGVDDLKGLTIRTPAGMVTKVFNAAGAKAIELTGGQVMPALEKGIIEAADYTVFSTNQSMGFNDIAPNPVYPGFHSMPMLDFSISKSKWDELPPDLQNLLTHSIREFADHFSGELHKDDLKAIEIARQNPKITIHDWSPEERKKFRRIAQKQWEIIANESEDAKMVYDSITNYLKARDLL